MRYGSKFLLNSLKNVVQIKNIFTRDASGLEKYVHKPVAIEDCAGRIVRSP
jgi:hypothetical protein